MMGSKKTNIVKVVWYDARFFSGTYKKKSAIITICVYLKALVISSPKIKPRCV